MEALAETDGLKPAEAHDRRTIQILMPRFCLARVSTLKDFFLFKEIFAIARKKKEIQNKRKYEENFKKLKKIEKTLS